MWPKDWRTWVAIIAATFHFPANEILGFSVSDLRFWAERVSEYTKEIKKTKK
jgi:hypothetical protein